MLRHPLDDALRTSEEPPRAAFLAGVTRLWPDPFTSQNENVGLYLSPIKAPCTGSPAAPLGLAGHPGRPAHGQPPFPTRQSGPPPTHSCPVREPSRRRRALPPPTKAGGR